MGVKVKRIYEKVGEGDGLRVLVDRLWPRGVSKEKAKLDYWLKELGPSTELRMWFGHDPKKFEEFRKKYNKELQHGDKQKELKKLQAIAKENDHNITLLFSARNEEHNHVRILEEILHNRKGEIN